MPSEAGVWQVGRSLPPIMGSMAPVLGLGAQHSARQMRHEATIERPS